MQQQDNLDTQAPSVLRRHWAWLALAAVLLSFFVLKLYSLNFVSGDEHMYFYMSLLVSRGQWPYRDFFFSHPPLQLYVMGAFYKLFGYSLALSKLVPSLAAMVSAVHVFFIGRKLVGRAEGVIGAALFLFTFDVLRGSSHFTGANCALAWGMAAAYQALSGRSILAGALFAIGTFTGIYIAPLALMLGVLLAFRDWKESLRLFTSYAVTCLLVCVVFAGVAGWQPFWYQIFDYNLHKIAFRYSWYAKFRNVAYLNSLVMLGFVPGIVWGVHLWISRGRPRGTIALPGWPGRLGAWLNLWNGDRVAALMLFAIVNCGYFYFYSTRVDYYSYYFMLIMPWMGLATATFAVDGVRYALSQRSSDGKQETVQLSRAERRRREQTKRKHRDARPGWRVAPLVTCGVALGLVLIYRQGIAGDRQTEMGEESSHYTWRDSAYLPGVVNAAIHSMFWSDVGDSTHPPNTITHYLQHEALSSGAAEGFARAVQAECKPGERIFGEYSLGPFAAALGPCTLAANLADTNPHRFKVRESTPEQWIAALEKDHLDIAIVVPGSAMLRERAMRDYLTQTFPRVVATWDDAYAGHVELRRRKN